MSTLSPPEIKQKLFFIPDNKWKSTPTYNSRESKVVSWLPLFYISSENILGLTKSGYWTVGSDDSIIVFEPEMPLVSLFPCLEIEYVSFREVAENAFSHLQLPQEIIDTFPTSRLIGLALTEGSSYWAELALNWLEYIEIDEQLKKQLQQTTQAKWISQKTRQKASKFLRGKIKQKTQEQQVKKRISKNIREFAQLTDATTEEDLDKAGQHLANFITTLGQLDSALYYAEQWENSICWRRSAIEAVKEMYKNTVLKEFYYELDTEDLDDSIEMRAYKEGYLKEDQIPKGIPATHWWWWSL